ncbi:MAG: 16S rRNA (guanine(966)-N(2))-methyltransferase RsmD [Dehalococcoidia bacterium]
MRVIAGTAKGRRLASPRGSSVRPSSERVRSAVFSTLESAGADLGRVLDLYAGTGSFGIEALSRGVGWVDFVEQDPKHAAVIKANLTATGLEGRARVYRRSVERALDSFEDTYGVIFLDPPYADSDLGVVMERLARSQLAGEDTTIVVEHSRHTTLGDSYGGFTRGKMRRYGDTVVSIYHQEVTS